MRQGTVITRIIIAVLFAGVLAYFGVYLWNSLTKDSATATLYTYTGEQSVDSIGYFFRDEVLLTDRSSQAELLASEGERIGVGDAIARIYSSSEGYALQQQLDQDKSTLESLEYIQSRVGSSATTVAMEESIVDTFTTLRCSASNGDLDDLSSRTTELKSLVFRRDYSTSGVDALSQQIEETQAEIQDLTQRTSSAYEVVTAEQAGMFSADVDGYEGVLTVEAVDSLTPSRLSALAGKQKEIEEDVIGKVITSNDWYFACNVSTDEKDGLYVGARVTLRFEDAARDYSAVVRSISTEENGMITVVFSSRNYASQLTGLRNQSVKIITDTETGLRVPKRAVRVLDDGTVGVYRVSGAQAEWVPVNVLWEEGDYFLIEQADKVDEEGNTVERSGFEKASILREGDEVITKGGALYDGKVMED